MLRRNTLKQIRQIIYTLKRNFGVPVDIYVPNTPVHDIRTGKTSITYSITRLNRVVVLTGDEIRTFTYDLSFIASNKNFTYGGFFDREKRLFIFDKNDLAKDFEFDSNYHLVFDNRKFEVRGFSATAGNYATSVLGIDTKESPNQVQHQVKVRQQLGVSQNVTRT